MKLRKIREWTVITKVMEQVSCNAISYFSPKTKVLTGSGIISIFFLNKMQCFVPLFVLFIAVAVISAQDSIFVPPLPDGIKTENPAAAPTANTAQAAAAAPADAPSRYPAASKDPVLGERIAKISATLEKIPQEHRQIWREYDITPYTRRKFPVTAGNTLSKPEQTVIDWTLRLTGTQPWHSSPFSILNADSDKLYAYHTKEVQLVVADIVDRFVCQELTGDFCTLRAVAVSRPDWQVKPHAGLKPIAIAAAGLQGWILEKPAAALLMQELAKRLDFKELVPIQPAISNGTPHYFTAKRQQSYLRDVQANPAAVNGYTEDRAVIEEGLGLSFVSLSLLDAQSTEAAVKADIIQIERMLSTFVEIATASNPRQRVSIETPQIAAFKLDELIRFPKNKVLLLDLGMIPLPNTAVGESGGFFSEITKGINPAKRGNVLVFIESSGK
ncbi:MAG: hypothetical protein LBT46_06940 [Planctomycetaceae bacterium]|nr:hypothetical protein [Planctomycetaceae bacterium]